jgi:diadenosine tetraphosphate (Ap4A) HIT family hydrolase
MNPTIAKFGYPATLLHEYRTWVVLLRPAQPTLGSLVLACKEDTTSLGAGSAEAYAELAPATAGQPLRELGNQRRQRLPREPRV